MSFLESRAVRTSNVRVRYQQEIERFMAYANHDDLRLVADAEVDEAVSQYLNRLFLLGFPSNKGDYMMASLLHFFP
eukprot:10097799-Lingulodinium_polyedra.AAC.1